MTTTIRWTAWVVVFALSGMVACGDTKSPVEQQDVIEDVGVEDIAPDVEGPDVKWQGKCIQGPGFCDDNNPCTDDDCDANAGCINLAKDCKDDDPCTIDACDISTGACKHVKDTCEDGNACTVGTCDASEGCLYVGLDCTDGDNCTSDGCSPLKGCLNTPLNCDDGVTCSEDTCDPSVGCVYDKPQGVKCCESPTDCEDGNVCTAHTCEAGICQTESVLGCCDNNQDCDDGNPCTSDTCALSTGQCSNAFQPGQGCCQTDEECDDKSACTNDACVKGQCGYEVTCCTNSAACDGGVPVGLCGDTTCTDGGCAVLPSAATPCCASDVAQTGFEASGGWSYNLVGAKSGVWKVQTQGLSTLNKTAYAGSGAATFQSTQSDLPGGQAVARLIFDEVELTPARPATLSFYFRAYLIGGTQGDVFRVRVETAVGSWYVWQAKGTSSNFQKVQIDLRGFAGRASTRKMTVVFEVKPNAIGSNYGRVWLDAISLNAQCDKSNACQQASDCDDGVGATEESCSTDGLCVYKTTKEYCESITACNDKNYCTKDTCNNFACAHVPTPNCCTKSIECADSNPCTTDYCSGLKCQYVLKSPKICCYQQKDCDDGNPCTIDQCPAVGLGCAYTQTSANCCTADGDCDDKDKCTLDLCESNSCTHTNQCCKADIDCDDNDDLCTKDTCDSMGMCLWTPINAAGCCEKSLYNRDFEDGKVDGLVFQNAVKDVKWQLVSGKKASGGKAALYYGNLASNNYDAKSSSGASMTHKGAVIIKGLSLPATEKSQLSFDLWMHTEPGKYFDKFEVYVATGKQTLKVWDKQAQGFTMSKWQTWKVNLSAWAGMTIDLRFQFDTLDAGANSTEGVYLDNMSVDRACAKKTCNVNTDCDDGLLITKELCKAGQCVYDL
ncbi:MAG: hypothetical protein CMH53_01930 [Myxococcales bacterium]|nr:hypothetical protein [Myxococcales bacterium]